MNALQNMKTINQGLVKIFLLLLMMCIAGINTGVQSRYITRSGHAKPLLNNYMQRKHKEEANTETLIGRWLRNKNNPEIEPQGVSVDPQERFVFWIDAGPPHRIWRSHLDSGVDNFVIVPEIVVLPIWLVADYSKKRLYFAGSSSSFVHSVDYYGQNRKMHTLSEIQNLLNSNSDVKHQHHKSVPEEETTSKDETTAADTRQRIGEDVAEVSCPAVFLHGNVEERCSLQPGSYCTFTCDVGFKPVSYLTMWCLGTGNWSHDINALCKEVLCPVPRPPLSTLVQSCVPPHHPGSECTFSCPIGLDVSSGSETITCNEHGDWSDDPLSCGGDDYSYSYSYSSSIEIERLEFVARPSDSLLNFGAVKLVDCEANDESAEIQWLKDGQPLPSESVSDVFILSSGTLFISEVEEHHAGTYTCKAYRPSTGEVIQAEGDLSFPSDQIFETSPENSYTVVGDDHVLQCVTHDPTLLVMWEKDGDVLEYTEAIHKVPQSDNLLIRGAFLTDSGRYTCVAMTFDGNRVAETSADLTVLPQQDVKEICGTITAPAAISSNVLREDATQEGRIVNGTLSVRGSAPWLSRLWNRSTRRHFCAASLINRVWAVTAAHCILDSGIQRDDLMVRVGDFDTYVRESDEQLLTVSAIIVHENFDESDFDSDIALIKMAEPIEMFDDYVRPICILNRTTGEEMLTPGVKGQVVGWGRVSEEGHYSQFMKEVMLQVRDKDRCEQSTVFSVTNNMFCAGSPKREGDACEGDSGGSFAVEEDGRWYLGGVVSWGEGCAREGKFGFYTMVPLFYEWIHNTIANN